MKKTVIFILLFGTLILLFARCEKSKMNTNENRITKKDGVVTKKIGEPERLINIPKNTIWGGHLDGGFWFELMKKYDNSKYRFRIYNDYNGNLVLDADFTIVNPKKKVDIKSINEIEIFFMFKYLEINEVELKPIYPAYGGEYWEIAKKTGF